MAQADGDLAALAALNEDYIHAVQNADVARFREILAEDFSASLADAPPLDKRAFLLHTAKPVTITRLRADDVDIRVLGAVAVIHGRTSYVTADGQSGSGRYTDVWAKRDGRWLAIAAHVTRNA